MHLCLGLNGLRSDTLARKKLGSNSRMQHRAPRSTPHSITLTDYLDRLLVHVMSSRRPRQHLNRRRLVMKLDVGVHRERQADVAVACQGPIAHPQGRRSSSHSDEPGAVHRELRGHLVVLAKLKYDLYAFKLRIRSADNSKHTVMTVYRIKGTGR